ncbi:MAG: hypothetical protein IPN94_27335 [Sphingobacteriales bacterium]|nr:hypothetical protein [Sphingobacteriales bacterium]
MATTPHHLTTPVLATINTTAYTAKAMQQADTSKRYDRYKRADNLLMEEAPIVPLYYDEVLRFTNKRVSDLGINGFNLLSLKNVRLSNK